MIYIGAESIISPLGNSAEENFTALKKNISGIGEFKTTALTDEKVFLSKFSNLPALNLYDFLLNAVFNSLRERLAEDIFLSDKTGVIISTTKGDIEREIVGTIENSVSKLQKHFSFKNIPLVVSNACASGVMSINMAANLINAGIYEHCIVVGCDVISDFVLRGFNSLFAISKSPCAPFDKERMGITLGEGCAGLILSQSKNIFKEVPMKFVAGTSSNDANHISGPSKTGEGLYRTVKKTLNLAGIKEKEIDFISAHGTATVYNDDMESVAFDRLNMSEIPMNSFKGYFGHTLGAAGLIETAMCLQSMRNNLLIKSLGYTTPGTVKKLHIISENVQTEVNTVLKTSSGFGGCNASLILRKI